MSRKLKCYQNATKNTSLIIDEILIYWFLKKFGTKRGYVLTPNEWKILIPYSENEMNKKFEQWQKKK